MQSFPHHYKVVAAAEPAGDVDLSADRLETLKSAPPVEFDGPGNRWSPESLLVAAVADCFVLSFRAVAAASKLPWTALRCEVEGTLERVDGVSKFTRFSVAAKLEVPPGTTAEKARRILDKAEAVCLITNSLSGTTHLDAEVSISG